MVTVRKYSKKDLHQSASLIFETFQRFNFKDNPRVVSENYAAAYNPAANLDDIRKRFEDTSSCYVAVGDGRIIGVLRAIENRPKTNQGFCPWVSVCFCS